LLADHEIYRAGEGWLDTETPRQLVPITGNGDLQAIMIFRADDVI
jgi:hypothetical protein